MQNLKKKVLKESNFIWDCTCRSLIGKKAYGSGFSNSALGCVGTIRLERYFIMGPLLWKEICLTTKMKGMAATGRKLGHLSCLSIFTLDVPLAWKIAWQAPDLCLAAHFTIQDLMLSPSQRPSWLHYQKWFSHLASLHLIFFKTITHHLSLIACLLLLYIYSLFPRQPHPKLVYLLDCPAQYSNTSHTWLPTICNVVSTNKDGVLSI